MRTSDPTLYIQQLGSRHGNFAMEGSQWSGVYLATVVDTDQTNTSYTGQGMRVLLPDLSQSQVWGPIPYPGSTAPPNGTAVCVGFNEATGQVVALSFLGWESSGGGGGGVTITTDTQVHLAYPAYAASDNPNWGTHGEPDGVFQYLLSGGGNLKVSIDSIPVTYSTGTPGGFGVDAEIVFLPLTHACNIYVLWEAAATDGSGGIQMYWHQSFPAGISTNPKLDFSLTPDDTFKYGGNSWSYSTGSTSINVPTGTAIVTKLTAEFIC